MKIAIDCRLIGSSGIGTFIENVVAHITEEARHTYLLIGHPDRLAAYRARSNCRVVACTLPGFSLNELLRFPTAEVNRCDAFYTPNFNIPMGIRIPVYSTIHDIVFLDTDHFSNPAKKLLVQWFLRRALRVSRTVFTVSHFSRNRILTVFPTATPLVVVPNGISRELQQYAEAHPTDGPREGIVFLGNLKKHKGIRTLIEAYDLLQQTGTAPTLTIIGRFNFRTKDEQLVEMVETHRDRIRFVTDADNDEVFRLMSHAEVLISPSLYEGFGIPPLEAMYLGTPAIISDIPVYKEVYEHLPVTFFKAGSTKDLYEKMQNHHPTTINIRKEIDHLYNYQTAADRILNTIYGHA
ncbi:MAG: glycosyltransferase family 4 protein [Prevotella sp.]|nr:glycosyltransferase family 4 protein [Prevotella sp.]MDY4039556.1 glycosyltransferase family 1 protein [Prevotella sp.]